MGITIRDFWGSLPIQARWLLSIVAVEFLGTGLVMGFGVVYFNEVRHFSLGTSGLLLGLAPFVSFIVLAPGGMLIDRLGAKWILAIALAANIGADIALTFAHDIGVAALAMTLSGIGQGLSWPAANALVAHIVPSEQRQRYYGINFSLLNVGVGVGGVVGGLVVDVHRTWTFQALYLIDALSFIPTLLVVLLVFRGITGRAERAPHAPKASYRAVLRSKAVPTTLLVSFLSAFAGYAQFNTGSIAFARDVAHVSTRTIGFSFAANTALIVLLQWTIIRRIDGHRRTRVLLVMAATWAVSWLVLGAAGLSPGTVTAAVLVCVNCAIFAVGETLLQPTMPAIVNDLVDDHVRGRMNALNAGMYNAPSFIGPPVAGALIGAHLGWLYIALLLVTLLALSVLVRTRLEPQLSAEQNGLMQKSAA